MHPPAAAPDVDDDRPAVPARWPAIGLACAIVLAALSMAVPAVTGWEVHIAFPPLHASWHPQVGLGTVPALALGAAGIGYGARLSSHLSWRALLLLTFAVSVGWLLSLAMVEGIDGIRSNFDFNSEYLLTARSIDDIPEMIRSYASHIEYGPDNWSIQPATHPPAALLFFVLLVRCGVSDSLAVGLVVTLLAATIPAAVLITLRALGDERGARLAAPFLVLAPAAVWETLSGDAVFACLAAWGIAVLAIAATRRDVVLSVVAGLLLGTCVMMSYGLPLLGFVALAVLAAARTLRPLPWAVAAASAVVAAFWVAGFSLFTAFPLLHQRYWAGVAHARPNGYWLWGDIAALCLCAGPLLGAGISCLVSAARSARRSPEATAPTRAVCWLAGGGLLAVVAADVSLMSKGEVERIWLPFVPWLLILGALLPPRWRRPMLAGQVVTALLVQHLLHTLW